MRLLPRRIVNRVTHLVDDSNSIRYFSFFLFPFFVFLFFCFSFLYHGNRVHCGHPLQSALISSDDRFLFDLSLVM